MKGDEINRDPYFSDIPWEIIMDERGNVIGEVYMLLSFPQSEKPKCKQKKHGSNLG